MDVYLTREDSPAKDAGEIRDAIVEKLIAGWEKPAATQANPGDIKFCAESGAETPDTDESARKDPPELKIDPILHIVAPFLAGLALGYIAGKR